MADKSPTGLIDELHDFFNDKSSYIPRLCFPETNQEVGESTYFIIALFKNMPDNIIRDMTGIGFTITSYQMEKVGEEFLAYIIARSEDKEKEIGELESLFSNDSDVINKRIRKISALEKNPFTYPVKPYSGVKRSLLLDHDLFHALFRTITSSLGSGGDYLMYMSGISVADHIWNKYDLGQYEELDDQFLVLEDLLRTVGFGMVTFEDIDPLRSEGKIVIKNSLEESLSESCPLLRGLLTEILRRIFEDSSIEVVETSCVNRGDDVCVFELTRVRKL
ncbi:MAG TPA: hypothetical protein PK718_06465 [Candidatus Methanofastidiosa archaeon]|nr:hypothetical protein [Candidatus Methanofastidiosa archaeon]HPR42172.1 hypothetical protein [Candidatus Methanofastidiosa archaeon]